MKFRKLTVLGISALGVMTFVRAIPAVAEEIPVVVDSSMANAIYSEGLSAIPGLQWEGGSKEPTFTIEGQKNGKPAARVSGTFTGKNAGTLLFSAETIQRAKYKDDSEKFSVLIPLIARKTPLKIKYIDDYGNLKSQDVEIVYENFYQFQLNQPIKKKWSLDTGASISSLNYTQTSTTSDVKISQIGITPKIGVTYSYSPKLDFAISSFGTLIGLPQSKTPEGASTPRFYGVNMRAGYKVYGLPTGNIYIMTGAYFWGMIGATLTDGNPYGVVSLSGPQLFVVGRFLTPGGKTIVGYVKGATILDGDGGLSLNRELAIGGAYQLTSPKAKRRFMGNLDFANAKFFVKGENIALTSLSLGISTSF